jgi:probable addiction module antidote protein
MSKTIKSTKYQDYLIEKLKSPEEAVGYLNAALEGGDISVFLLALQNVVKAQGGVSKIAQNANKSRTSLYKAFSKDGNPYLKNTATTLNAMNMHFEVVPNRKVV